MTKPLAPTTIGERQAIAEGVERRCLLDERIRIARQVTASYDGLDWPADVREAWKRIEADLATPKTNAPVAEAVDAEREACAQAAEKLVRFDRKNADEQQRARADAFQAGQRHAATAIRARNALQGDGL